MKTGKTILMLASFLLIMAGLVSLGSCKKKTVAPDAAALLKSGTWKIKTVTVDGTDQLALFTGMTLTFSTSNFTSTNGAPVWPASGTWTLNSDKTFFTRNDGVAVFIDKLTESSLGLSLAWDKTTVGGGRAASVKGAHVFTFGK